MERDEIKLHSPAHVSDFVREIIEGHGLNVTMGAAVLGVTRQALSNLVNHHFGLSSDMALRMQTIWEIAETRKREGEFEIERYVAA